LNDTSNASITTEVLVIGAGPAGLFQVFELGLLGIKAHVLDSLSQPGGQCTELYPDKPIYDIPALPICGAQELVDRLMQQIKPFGAGFHLGEEAIELQRKDDGRFRVVTGAGTVFDAGAVVIAAGVGSFQPRRLVVPDVEAFEGSQVHYRIKNVSDFHGRKLVIFGGGDSALDWTLALASDAAGIVLVHRRAEFRAAPASVARMQELAAHGKLSGEVELLEAEHLLVFFGLAPKLGPIADWGLEIDKRAIKVDTEKFGTNIPGVFAIGDINTYPGKKKLILSGFHEAALAAFAVQHYLYPAKKQFLQYTTTSPAMQRRLGVTNV
jgi:thioredoxin reductase (NADPH)